MHQYAYKIRHTALGTAEYVAVSKRPVRRVQGRDPAGAGTARSEVRYTGTRLTSRKVKVFV